MNVSPDQVRAATRSAAAVITKDKVPPLRLDEPRRVRRPARRPRSAWVAPLAAAAAVVLVAAGSAVAASSLGHSGKSSGAAQPGSSASSGTGVRGAPADLLASVPAYYVVLEHASAVVRVTATGAAKFTIHMPFVGVTAAADDRTFVLDVQRPVVADTVTWPDQPVFYLLRLSASGAEESFTRLALPGPAKGTAVTGLALSPDGSKLAVEVDADDNGHLGLLEIRIYTLATGAFRSWTTNASSVIEDPDGFTGSGVDGSANISWTADSRTLAFGWANNTYLGVRLLDTAASGDDLIADSRLAVILFNLKDPPRPVTSKDNISSCVTDAIISQDGSAIVCGYTTGVGRVTTSGFVRYSAKTGKPTTVLGPYTVSGQTAGNIALYWTNSTGTVAIEAIPTPSGARVEVTDGETVTPLPGTAGLVDAAW